MRVLDRRARQGADEALLDVRDPALSLFLDEVRALQHVSAPAPAGDLAMLLQDGFEATPQAARPLHRRRTTGVRRVSRVAVIAAPLGMKIATAAFAAAATFGGAAALGVLPDWLLPWSGNHAGDAYVDRSSAPAKAAATAPVEGVADFLPVRRPDADAFGLGALDAAAARRAAAEREDRRADADQERRGPDEDAGEKAEGAADDAVRDQEDAEDAEDAADDERDTTERDDATDEDADDADDAPDQDADDADDTPDQDADGTDDAPDRDDSADDAPEDAADDAVDRADDAADDATDAAEGAKDAADAADGVEDPDE